MAGSNILAPKLVLARWRDKARVLGLAMNLKQKLKDILNHFGIVSFCEKCGTRMLFDEERFRLGYSAREYCPKCENRQG